jgi:hypothetical protein
LPILIAWLALTPAVAQLRKYFSTSGASSVAYGKPKEIKFANEMVAHFSFFNFRLSQILC